MCEQFVKQRTPSPFCARLPSPCPPIEASCRIKQGGVCSGRGGGLGYIVSTVSSVQNFELPSAIPGASNALTVSATGLSSRWVTARYSCSAWTASPRMWASNPRCQALSAAALARASDEVAVVQGALVVVDGLSPLANTDAPVAYASCARHGTSPRVTANRMAWCSRPIRQTVADTRRGVALKFPGLKVALHFRVETAMVRGRAHPHTCALDYKRTCLRV